MSDDDAVPDLVFEVFAAGTGDAFLLHYTRDGRRSYGLIDGGPTGTFDRSVLPRLREIDPEGVALQWVVVTHVDSDHVNGVLDLVDAQNLIDDPPTVGALFWNNPRAMNVRAAAQGGADPAVNQLELLVDRLLASANTAGVQPVSYETGNELVKATSDLGIPMNPPHRNRLLTKDHLPEQETGPLKITVVWPSLVSLERMLSEWQDKKPLAVAPAKIDDTATNLSSLVLLVEHAKKSLLLCGDARGDHILEGLRELGHTASPDNPFRVDLLKIPHHGSDRNLFNNPGGKDWRFFDSIIADHYVLSANGQHENPSPTSVRALIEANASRTCEVWFSTPLAADPTLKRAVAYRAAVEEAHAAIADTDATKVKVHVPEPGALSTLIPLR